MPRKKMKHIILLALSLAILAIVFSAGCIPQKKDFGGEEMAEVLFVIAPEDFKDVEYFKPKEILENGGVKVITVSTVNQATGTDGAEVKVDLLLSNVNEDYDGIVFIGGPGAEIYFNSTKAHKLVKSYYAQGKIVGAICISPVTLANAGILRGKKATVFPTAKDKLSANGCRYTAEKVTVDSNIITASDPTAAEQFGRELLKKFK